MKKFWIDYVASMQIEAETEEEARQTFYQVYSDNTRQYPRIDSVEEIEGDE